MMILLNKSRLLQIVSSVLQQYHSRDTANGDKTVARIHNEWGSQVKIMPLRIQWDGDGGV
jgi:hypothetical protein